MRNAPRQAWLVLTALALFGAALAGCNGLGNINGTGGGGTPTTSPSASPTATPSTAPCQTQDPNAIIVDMALEIPGTTSNYGAINGYAVDPGTGTLPTQAAVIDATASGAAITTNDVVQFANVETTVYKAHSAVGFPGRFPAQGYVFPSPAASPTGTTISSTLWSTGRIAPSGAYGSECYSKPFALTAGTWYFGDLDFYSENFRDVIVVASPLDRRAHNRERRSFGDVPR